MITNNKYIRGNIGEFDKQVSSNIKIEDYEGNKANKYLVTKEYLNLNNQISFFYPEYVFPIIIRDEDLENILGDTETIKIEKLFSSIKNKNYFLYCKDFYIEDELNGYFIRQYKEIINENNEDYYIFKNYFIKVKLSYINSELSIKIININEKKELISGKIYKALTYSYTNKDNDSDIYVSINLQQFLCIDKNSILPIIPLSFSFPTKYFEESYGYSPNKSFINLNYQNNIINYLGYNYHNDILIYTDSFDLIQQFNFIFETKLNISINKISKNIDTTEIYKFKINSINNTPNDNTLNDIYFTMFNLSILSFYKDYYDDDFINFNKILTTDYNNIFNESNYNLFPLYNTINNTKITLTSFSGKLKDEENTKIIYSKEYIENNYNITYYSFEYNNNIYNYTIYTNKLSLLDANYREYTNKIFFPKYDDNQDHFIPSLRLKNIFLCNNYNGEISFNYFGKYLTDDNTTTFINIINNSENYLRQYFVNDLFLNVICSIFETEENKLELRLKIINPSLSKYMIYDWIPLYNDDDNDYNYDNNYIFINYLRNSITYKAYIKPYSNSGPS